MTIVSHVVIFKGEFQPDESFTLAIEPSNIELGYQPPDIRELKPDSEFQFDITVSDPDSITVSLFRWIPTAEILDPEIVTILKQSKLDTKKYFIEEGCQEIILRIIKESENFIIQPEALDPKHVTPIR